MNIRLNESLAIGESVYFIGVVDKIKNIQYGNHYVRVWLEEYTSYVDLPNGDKLRFCNQLPVVL